MDAMTVQIAKLELKAGDTLAVMVPFVLRKEQHEAVRAMLKDVVPDGVKAVVFDGGVTIAKISSD